MDLDPNKKNMLIYLAQSPDSIRMLSIQSTIFNYWNKKYNIIYAINSKTKSGLKYFIKDGNIPSIENTIYLGEDIQKMLDSPGENTWDFYIQNSKLLKIINKNNIDLDVIVSWGWMLQEAKTNVTKILELSKLTKNQTFQQAVKRDFTMLLMYELLKKNDKTIFLDHTIDTFYLKIKFPLPNKHIYTHENSTTRGHKKLDCYQYGLLNTHEPEAFKTCNLVFGCHAWNSPERTEIIEILKEKIKGEHFFYRIKNDNEDEISNLLPRDEYNRLIKTANYTIILSAYVEDAFSITRLCDAVYHDCCPLFDKRCNFDILAKDFGIEKEIIEPLIIDVKSKEKIKYPSDETRDKLVSYLYDKLFTNLVLDVIED